MKRFLLGLIVGSALAFTTSTYADDIKQLVGKAVDNEYPVILNGEALQNRAPSIAGTSYAPVREIATALGLEVDFRNDTVFLDNPKSTEEEDMNNITRQIDGINNMISNALKMKKNYMEQIPDLEKKGLHDLVKGHTNAANMIQDEVDKLEAQKAELEAQLAEVSD